MSEQICPDCGATLRDGRSCQEQFEALLFLEYDYPQSAARVHHLMVMCYMLQHNRYSDEAARWVIDGLKAFLEHGVSPAQLRKQNRDVVDSGLRKWKVIGSTTLTRNIAWPLTIMDVNSVDPVHYCVTVNAWARATLDAVRARQAG